MNYRIEFAVWRATAENPKPDVRFVPMMERRRLTGVERAALATAWAVRGDGTAPVVFSSRWGEIGVTAKLMRQFHEEGEMSPAGFSASVHNAAPGALSLLTGNRAPYTAIAARDRSLESGLLEALAMGCETLFVHAEEATPDLYLGEFEDTQAGCSVAMRLVPCGVDGDGAIADDACDGESAIGGEAARDGSCFSVVYRHAEMAPATFDVLVDFLEGRAPKFETCDFEMSRKSLNEQSG